MVWFVGANNGEHITQLHTNKRTRKQKQKEENRSKEEHSVREWRERHRTQDSLTTTLLERTRTTQAVKTTHKTDYRKHWRNHHNSTRRPQQHNRKHAHVKSCGIDSHDKSQGNEVININNKNEGWLRAKNNNHNIRTNPKKTTTQTTTATTANVRAKRPPRTTLQQQPSQNNSDNNQQDYGAFATTQRRWWDHTSTTTNKTLVSQNNSNNSKTRSWTRCLCWKCERDTRTVEFAGILQYLMAISGAGALLLCVCVCVVFVCVQHSWVHVIQPHESSNQNDYGGNATTSNTNKNIANEHTLGQAKERNLLAFLTTNKRWRERGQHKKTKHIVQAKRAYEHDIYGNTQHGTEEKTRQQRQTQEKQCNLAKGHQHTNGIFACWDTR